MNIFEKVLELQAELHTVRNAITENSRNVDEIISVIKERVASDVKTKETRIDELQRLSTDQAKTETVRKMYAAELEKLEAVSPTPTDAEKDMLLSALAEYEQSAKDYFKVDKDFSEALREARGELENIRDKEHGVKSGVTQPDLVLSWVESKKESVKLFING